MSTPTGPRGSAVGDHARLSLLVALGFVGGIVAFIWVVQPRASRSVEATCLVLLVAFAIGSNVSFGDSARRLGLRLDNLLVSAAEVGLATALAAALLVVAGAALHTLQLPSEALTKIVRYAAWGFVQQYGLQAVVFVRLTDARLTRGAPVVAALLFMLPHLPNPTLCALTFAAGWMWCVLFRRQPNLITLAFSHGVLAVLAETILSGLLPRGLHVGPGYFR